MPPALAERGVTLRLLSWERLLRMERTPAGTYVLTDFDRLSPIELECAGLIATRLRDSGARVLNDPARFLPRPMFLGALQAAGLNDVAVWLPGAGQWPDRYPAFLRTSAAHRGPASDLIHDRAGAEQAVAVALAQGMTLADLMYVAFAAAPVDGTLWQKHAAFLIGNRVVRANTVNDSVWNAKRGTLGAAPDTFYAQERAEMENYPHEAAVRAVFAAAGQQFGRMDFGLRDGRVVTYEINTNPFLPPPRPHPNADRTATMQIMFAQLADALAALAPDTTMGQINIAGLFARGPRLYRWRPRRH